MVNDSSARSAAHLAQGMSQLGVGQLGISTQVSLVHPLCLVLELFFFLGRVRRGAQARNTGGKVSTFRGQCSSSSSNGTIPQLIGKLSIPFDYAFVDRGGGRGRGGILRRGRRRTTSGRIGRLATHVTSLSR